MSVGTKMVYTDPIPAKLVIGDQEIDVIIEELSHEEIENRHDYFGNLISRDIHCKDTFVCTIEFTKRF